MCHIGPEWCDQRNQRKCVGPFRFKCSKKPDSFFTSLRSKVNFSVRIRTIAMVFSFDRWVRPLGIGPSGTATVIVTQIANGAWGAYATDIISIHITHHIHKQLAIIVFIAIITEKLKGKKLSQCERMGCPTPVCLRRKAKKSNRL